MIIVFSAGSATAVAIAGRVPVIAKRVSAIAIRVPSLRAKRSNLSHIAKDCFVIAFGDPRNDENFHAFYLKMC